MKQALEQGAFQEGGNGGRVRDSPTLKVIMMMLLGVMIMIITIYIYIYIYIYIICINCTLILMLQGSHFMAAAANRRWPQVGQE